MPGRNAPATWLQLTAAERASLVEPPPPLPHGHMHRSGPYGFTPEGVAVGGWMVVEDAVVTDHAETVPTSARLPLSDPSA